MSELLNKYSEDLKKISKDEKDLYTAQMLELRNKAKERSRIAAKAKREANIKQLAVDLPVEDIEKFKQLLRRAKLNKTELFQKMLQMYERTLNSQQQQQQQNNMQNQQRR